MKTKSLIFRHLQAISCGKPLDFEQLEELDKEISTLLKINYEREESKAKENNRHNVANEFLYLNDLNPLALNTSWFDVYSILEHINKEQPSKLITLLDLGAGNCRLAIIAHLFFPNIRILSVEAVGERMTRAIEICQNSHHIFYDHYFEEIAEELDFDYLFLYFPNGKVFEGILETLKKYTFNFSILCIESHGEMINRLSFERSWLETKQSIKLLAPRHNPHLFEFTKIKSTKTPLEIKLQTITNHSGEFLMTDQSGKWFASSQGLEFFFDKKDCFLLQFQNPPRTLEVSQETMDLIHPYQGDLSQEIRELLVLRDQGQVRKVYLEDIVELPSGKRIKKDQL